MSDWAVGLSTGCFYQKSIFEVLETIRNGGFSLIEICSSPRHLDYHDVEAVKRASEEIHRLGLEPCSFHAPFAEHIDITSLDKDRFDQSVGEILQAAEAASRLKVNHFVIHPGPEIEGRPPAEELIHRMENAVHALNRVGRRCDELGMHLTLENMLPHLLFGQVSDILWIVGAMSHMNIEVCLDTGHAHLAGDMETVVYKLSGHLKMIHANDNRGEQDDHLPPGQGRVDWERFLADLDRCGFRGSIILELSGDLDLEPESLLAQAREARHTLRQIVEVE